MTFQSDIPKRQFDRLLAAARNDDARSRWEQRTYWPMMVLAVATLPLVLIPEVADLSHSADSWILAADVAIWAVFVIDLVIRTWMAEHRVGFLLDHPFEVLIVVVPFLRPLRILRFTPVLRPLMASGLLAQVLRKRSASWALAAAGITIAVATVIVLIAERDVNDGIQDWGTVIWWGLATVTTVGYGDVVPVTAIGRIVGVLLMLVGIGIFGVLTANVAAWFVQHDKEVDQEQILVELKKLRAEVQSLREELASTSRED